MGGVRVVVIGIVGGLRFSEVFEESGIICGGVRAGDDDFLKLGIIAGAVRASEELEKEPGIICGGVGKLGPFEGGGVLTVDAAEEPGMVVGGVRPAFGTIVGGVRAGVAQSAAASTTAASSLASCCGLSINLGSSSRVLSSGVDRLEDAAPGGEGGAPMVCLRWFHRCAPGGGGGVAPLLRRAPATDAFTLASVLNMCCMEDRPDSSAFGTDPSQSGESTDDIRCCMI